MQLDDSAVLELVRLRDPLGVLSVYAETTPERQAHAQPQWVIEARNGLRELRRQLRDNGGPTAAADRLEQIQPELERRLDPKLPGRGRAFFAPLSGDELHEVSVQLPLSPAIELREKPFIRPLVAALDHGRPTGIALVDRSGLRLCEWRLGEASEIASYDFKDQSGEWREMKGPPSSNPAHHQKAAPQRDMFEERLDDHRVRFLKKIAGAELALIIGSRKWDRIVVSGDARFADPVCEELPASIDLLRSEHELRYQSPHEIAAALAPLFEDGRAAREMTLVQTALGDSAAGGHATTGLRGTLDALNAGRVRHLLYDEVHDAPGFRASDGRFFDRPDGHSDADLAEESSLIECMIERALETSAAVTPLDGEAAELLQAHDGVAALLRW